jgi:quercetin dioxygenase-like cupin family protein
MPDHQDNQEQRLCGIVVLPGEGRDIPLGEAGMVTMKVEGRATGGTISAYEFTSPPRTAGPPLHMHRSWDEALSVLEGEMTFLIDGEEHVAPAGSFVFIPRGVPHTFWNAGDAPVRQLTVFTPAGIEGYFDDVTRVMAAGGEETLEAAIALMEQHDMIVPPGTRPAYGALTPPI